MKPSPLQAVKKNFNTRGELVDKLVSMVDRFHGDSSDDDVRSRLMSLSNKKLLRLYKTEQKVREGFGSRDAVIEAIVAARKKAGLTSDADFVKSLESHSKARLLDMTNANHGERPQKQTPEQRMKSKRGKKQRERAKAKAS